VREKERWILAKLDEWSVAPKPARLRGASGERMPLFGEMVELERREGPVTFKDRTLGFDDIKNLVRWLKATALEALRPRAAQYAALLGQPAPRVALSSARTQWGVCTEGGDIRLHWRLVHVEPVLADYAVAHEVAHLAELNHSRRFWRVLENLYPDWRTAREKLELAGAALPIFKETS